MQRPRREPDDPRFTRIALRRELVAEGWTDQALRAQVANGVLVRIRQGAYVDAKVWAACDVTARHELRARAVLKQAKADAALTHVSGAVVWDVSTYDQELDDIDITRFDGRAGRAEAGVRQHRGRLVDGDVTERHGLAVVSATRLCLELPTVVDAEHAYCYIGELLHRGETTVEALRDRYADMRAWPGSLSTEALLRRVHGKCESVGEFRADHLFWKQGLPTPERQYDVVDPVTGELLGRVDFAWPDHGVFLEFDGLVKYHRHRKKGETIEEAVLREKRREERLCEVTGWRCIRIIWADLYLPEHTALRIRRLLFPAKSAA